MAADHSIREFRPELLPRRGEVIAWASALSVGGTWLLLAGRGQEVSPAVPILAIPLFLIALGISLSNWMDRQTVIQLAEDSVTFSNGLRHAHLKWAEIQQVQVLPAPWGRRVQVTGDQAHFSFRTLGLVKMRAEVRGRTGFAAGEQILQEIIAKGRLQEVERLTAWQPAGRYYVRE